jgi:hypothetical protein
MDRPGTSSAAVHRRGGSRSLDTCNVLRPTCNVLLVTCDVRCARATCDVLVRRARAMCYLSRATCRMRRASAHYVLCDGCSFRVHMLMPRTMSDVAIVDMYHVNQVAYGTMHVARRT